MKIMMFFKRFFIGLALVAGSSIMSATATMEKPRSGMPEATTHASGRTEGSPSPSSARKQTPSTISAFSGDAESRFGELNGQIEGRYSPPSSGDESDDEEEEIDAPPARPIPTAPPARPIPTAPPARPIPTDPPARPRGKTEKASRQRKQEAPQAPAEIKHGPLDMKLVTIGLYCLLNFDSSKEALADAATRLRLYKIRNLIQHLLPSALIDHPNRGMILALLAGGAGAFACSHYHPWQTAQQPGYNWINIMLSLIAGHFAYSSTKTFVMRPEYNMSFYRWMEELAQARYNLRKKQPPILPARHA